MPWGPPKAVSFVGSKRGAVGLRAQERSSRAPASWRTPNASRDRRRPAESRQRMECGGLPLLRDTGRGGTWPVKAGSWYAVRKPATLCFHHTSEFAPTGGCDWGGKPDLATLLGAVATSVHSSSSGLAWTQREQAGTAWGWRGTWPSKDKSGPAQVEPQLRVARSGGTASWPSWDFGLPLCHGLSKLAELRGVRWGWCAGGSCNSFCVFCVRCGFWTHRRAVRLEAGAVG